jgi:serine/threonine protein kinase
MEVVNPEKWEQMKGLFASALALGPGERSTFLRNACGDDQALLAEMEGLLRSYESEKSLPDEEHTGRSVAGQKIGPYKLIRRIGVGGMGAVYLAARADDTFNKRVAIKLVREGVDTEAVLRRFRQERQILAPLDHPNITKLLDGGTTEDELPYFVMDYVEGTRIDEYCDNHKLSIEERITLFREVCSAVQYIHQNLVVHRDLKPSNILVTAEGIPKLLDFGIAKLLKPEFFTSSLDATLAEFHPMTPGYASPEQVRGEPITTASDVYSLGVILYELLTSCRPYQLKGDTPDEIRRAVCDQQPEKPSTTLTRFQEGRTGARKKSLTAEAVAAMRATIPEKLRRQLSGDLDTIVLKALRKEPQRRYASVELLSEDLRRHQEGLPVTAHRDTWSYRAGKFVRRHKAGVAAAALVMASLIAGVVATSWQARVARHERAKAEQQFNDVRRLTSSFLFEFHDAIKNLPGATPARQLLVQRALEYLGKLASQSQGDASLQRELAEAYLKVGDVQGNPYGSNLGDTPGAARSYQAALDISQALVRANPKNEEAQGYLARSYKSLAEVLAHLGKPSEAVADLRQAIAILEPLTSSKPDDELRIQLAGSYQTLADLLGHPGQMNLGDSAGALENYRKALAVDESILVKEPGNQRVRRSATVVRMRIGDMRLQADDLQGAQNEYRSALDAFEAFAAAAPTDAGIRRLLIFGHRKLGGVQQALGDKRGALKNYSQAGAISEDLLSADPSNAQASMDVAITSREMGDLLWDMSNRPGALLKYQRGTNILGKLSAEEPENTMVSGRYAEMLVMYGQALAEAGKAATARPITAHGLRLTRELAARDDVTADEVSEYAIHFLEAKPEDLREPATALKYAKESIAKGATGADYLDILARAYFASGDVRLAIETEEKALNSLPSAGLKQSVSPIRKTIETQLAKFKAARR